MKRVSTVSVLIMVLFYLSACGGGGGGRASAIPQTTPDAVPIQPVVPAKPAFTTSFQTTEAPSANEVAEYLRIHAGLIPFLNGTDTLTHDAGLVRFSTIPTVLLASRATEHERAATYHAVSVINNSLPFDQHIRIEEDFVADARSVSLSAVPQNSILVAWHREGGEASYADLDYTHAYDTSQNRWERTRLNAARIRMFHGPDNGSTVLHELLHTLGLSAHPQWKDYPTSQVAAPRIEAAPLARLDEIESSAVSTLYTRLDATTEPEDLTADNLGQWDQYATVFSGQVTADNGPIVDGEVLQFGVTTHNGLSVPWTQNDLMNGHAAEALADNPELSGTVTWDGGLVGVTPDQAYVQGLTSIDVDMGTLTGTASFTNLEFWNGVPQAVGTGTQWNTGELEYDLSVSSMFLRSTGGDAGAVNGVFYGYQHNTVGGTLERADLTAAFGATR